MRNLRSQSGSRVSCAPRVHTPRESMTYPDGRLTHLFVHSRGAAGAASTPNAGLSLHGSIVSLFRSKHRPTDSVRVVLFSDGHAFVTEPSRHKFNVCSGVQVRDRKGMPKGMGRDRVQKRLLRIDRFDDLLNLRVPVVPCRLIVTFTGPKPITPAPRAVLPRRSQE